MTPEDRLVEGGRLPHGPGIDTVVEERVTRRVGSPHAVDLGLRAEDEVAEARTAPSGKLLSVTPQGGWTKPG
jgi:hypothetical protein